MLQRESHFVKPRNNVHWFVRKGLKRGVSVLQGSGFFLFSVYTCHLECHKTFCVFLSVCS